MNVLHGVGGLLGIANAFGNDEPEEVACAR
jgi:hypothetical protein